MLSLRGGDEPLTWPHLLHCQLSLNQMKSWFPWQPPHRSLLIVPFHPQFWQNVLYSATRMSSTRFKVVFPLQDGHFMEDDIFWLLIHLPQNKFNFTLSARASSSSFIDFHYYFECSRACSILRYTWGTPWNLCSMFGTGIPRRARFEQQVSELFL